MSPAALSTVSLEMGEVGNSWKTLICKLSSKTRGLEGWEAGCSVCPFLAGHEPATLQPEPIEELVIHCEHKDSRPMPSPTLAQLLPLVRKSKEQVMLYRGPRRIRGINVPAS